MTLTSGIHDDIQPAAYHADVAAPEPSLSAGIAKRLINQSPLHARAAHPKLNPDLERVYAHQLDFGSAAHALLLEGLDVCQIVEYDDWRTKAAKAERDAARADGLIPLLRKDYGRMCELVDAVRAQISQLDVAPLPLHDGKPEQTLVWQEQNGVWCRARIDWLHDAGDVIDDLKTSATSANPYVWARNRLFADGQDIACAFYRRGLKALTGVDAAWRFVVCEVDPPYGLSVISLAPAALALAEQKVERALELWRRCLETDEWPGYPSEIAYAEPPPYEEARFLEAHWEQDAVAA